MCAAHSIQIPRKPNQNNQNGNVDTVLYDTNAIKELATATNIERGTSCQSFVLMWTTFSGEEYLSWNKLL